ncbi:MAG: hypothetical protein ABSF74_00025 [Dehalococcoidia bacterium]|jgi:hypothetical protein
MDLSSFRDIVLIVWGVIASVATIYLCVVVASIYRQTAATMVSLNAAAERVKEIADQANKEVVEPLSKIGATFRGINQGIRFINKIITGKEIN